MCGKTIRCLLCCWLVAMMLVPTAIMSLRQPQAANLGGVETPIAPLKFDLRSWFDGSLVAGIEQHLSKGVGLRSFAIRCANQFDLACGDYHEFDRRRDVIVLDKDWLYGRSYLEHYVAPATQLTPQKTQAIVGNLARLHRELADRGQALVVVISPSKAERYPEHLPVRIREQRQQFSGVTDRQRFVSALKEHHVPCVDAPVLLDQMRAEGQDTFAKGGVHWNYLAAMHVWQQVVRTVNEAYSWNVQVPIIRSIEYDEARGTDRDLSDLLNVFRSPCAGEQLPYPVMDTRHDPSCKRPRILFTGTSFSMTLIAAMRTLRIESR